jgi:hypothetical protein
MSFQSLCALLTAFLVVGCQSVPDRLPRKMFVTTGTVNGISTPRETFKRGELPVVVVQGYGEQQVVLEMVRNGQLIASKAYDVPGPKQVVRDDGVGFASHSGMGVNRQKTLIVYKDQYLISMKEAPLGFYQVSLKMNGETKEFLKFSVLGNND